MSLALARTTVPEGTYCDTMTGKPNRVPPFMLTPENSLWPSGFCISDRESATVAGMIHTPEVGALFAAMNAPNTAWMSARTASASLPDEEMGVTPLVIDAGETPAVADLAGLMKSVDRKSVV